MYYVLQAVGIPTTAAVVVDLATAAMVLGYHTCTIHVWRMGGSRGLLDKSVVYTKVMCLIHPEATY